MIGKRQYSLGYLLGDVGLFALAMGLTRFAYSLLSVDLNVTADDELVGFVMMWLGAIPCWGAAIGGLFGRMIDSAVVLILFGIIALLVPAVNY